jgi:hypothetical protein
LDGHREKGRKAARVWTGEELRNLDMDNTDYLLGNISFEICAFIF